MDATNAKRDLNFSNLRWPSFPAANQSGKTALVFFQTAWVVLINGCMHKTYFYIMVIMLPLAAVVAAVMNKLKVQVPVGYQDENGFHTGTGRMENKVNWPPFW